jgi:hypothetical protein
MNKVVARAVLVSGLLTGVFVFSALAEEFLLRSTIIGSNPDTPIAGVPSGGASWTVGSGSAVLDGDGRLRVEVRDLILPKLGNPGRVTSVSASLVCGGAGGAVLDTTDAVPLSADGNAEIESRINIPSTCFGPVVLVRAVFNGKPGPWIASTGLTNTSEPTVKDDEGRN